ncbi:hypothetical protein HK099_000990, partial [Clydaea vesicula]
FQTLDLKTDLVLSMNMPCFNELKKYNVSQLLKKFYGNYLLDTPIDGFDVSLRLDLSNLPNSPEERAALIKSFSLLKRNAMAAPFELAFQAQQEGRQTELMPIHYREDEAIYVQAQQDRVTVIFSTVFKEETDRVFGKVFLQEFVDARRQPNIQNAPQVLYSNREPPLELRGLRGLKDSESIGYVTFGIKKKIIKLKKKKKKTRPILYSYINVKSILKIKNQIIFKDLFLVLHPLNFYC